MKKARTCLTLLTVLATGALVAPAWAQAGEVRDRARSAGLPAEQVEAVAAEVERTRADGLPTAPVVAKAEEGLAKGVPAPRVVAAMRTVRNRLARGRDLLEGAVSAGAAGPVRAGDVERMANALAAGVPPDALERMAGAAARSRGSIATVGRAAAAAERMRGTGHYGEGATAALAEAVSRGYGERDMRQLAEDYRRWVAAGGDPAAFPGGRGPERMGARRGAAEDVEEGRLPGEQRGAPGSSVPGVSGMGREGEGHQGSGGEGGPYRGGR